MPSCQLRDHAPFMHPNHTSLSACTHPPSLVCTHPPALAHPACSPSSCSKCSPTPTTRCVQRPGTGAQARGEAGWQGGRFPNASQTCAGCRAQQASRRTQRGAWQRLSHSTIAGLGCRAAKGTMADPSHFACRPAQPYALPAPPPDYPSLRTSCKG